jgi:uncharacterized protein (DUF1810 family)
MMKTPYDLQRFKDAQAPVYAQALKELQDGYKRTHWMWFIFPQLRGLGRSDMAHFYGITGAAEATAYLGDAVLGARLRECCTALEAHERQRATTIFGEIDALKLHSSLTLFAHASNGDALFVGLLAAYFGGEEDPRTLELLRA